MNRTRFLVDPMMAAALTLMAGTRAGAHDAVELDAAGAANDTAALLFYAADMGFYDKAGLRVKVTALNNPGAISSALVAGALQVGSFSITVGALAKEHGLPVVMIAPAGLYLSSVPTSGLLVLKDSPIRRAADLNGKTVAIRDLSNMSYFGAKQWIDRNGGDSKTVHWIEVPDTSAAAALMSGRIDAASVSEPALDDDVRGGNFRSLASVFDAIGKRFLISGYFTTEDFAKAQPDAIVRFADVMASTARWANQNQPQTAKILEKYLQTPVLPGSMRVTYAERLAVADVQPVLDLLVNYGILTTPMRARDLFSPLVPTR